MAESLFHTQNRLDCPICLTLLKDPVTTSCGHSFCMDCIKRCWDQDVHRGVYSCPTCRKTFNQRPALSRSIVLADILQGMKQKSPARPGDVMCDVCKGRKMKAVKSCLICLASYCQTHIRPHYESKAFKIHKLVKASPNLQQQICPQHHKALEVYCHDDRKCICVLCMGNQHSGHKTVSAASEMAKKQGELRKKKWDSVYKIIDLKKEVHQCKKAVISYKRSAQAAVENSDQIFNEIIRSIQNRQAEVRENIRAQENKEVQDAQNHIQSLEQEIGELQKENCKLEPLLHTENHIHFFQLQRYSLYSGVSPYNSSRDVSNLTFERVEQSLSELKSQLDEVCEEHMGGILDDVADVQLFHDDDLSEEEEEEEDEEEEMDDDDLWGGFEY